MRLGGMENEASLKSSKGGRNGPLLDLIHGITCIRSLGESPRLRLLCADACVFNTAPVCHKQERVVPVRCMRHTDLPRLAKTVLAASQ